MNRPLFYDRQGRALDGAVSWSQLLEDPGYKRVAEDHVGELWVSTVWIGLDENLSGVGPPLIFETMVFANHTDSDVGDAEFQWRWPTECEALAGHRKIVERLREANDA